MLMNGCMVDSWNFFSWSEDSNNVVVFSRNRRSGKLEDSGKRASMKTARQDTPNQIFLPQIDSWPGEWPGQMLFCTKSVLYIFPSNGT